jgi:predicted ester cyclase
VNESRMLELVRALAEAKSRRDLSAALQVQHADMVLESPAFGALARGLEENERALARFFKTFPDYDVVLDGHAANANDFVCWGTVRMTMVGERFGVTASGRRAVLPVFMRFTFKDDLIASEYFLIDLATLCAQAGVSTDAVRAKLFAG